MAKMTRLIATYQGMIPRLLVPRNVAVGWKSEKDVDAVRKAAGMRVGATRPVRLTKQ